SMSRRRTCRRSVLHASSGATPTFARSSRATTTTPTACSGAGTTSGCRPTSAAGRSKPTSPASSARCSRSSATATATARLRKLPQSSGMRRTLRASRLCTSPAAATRPIVTSRAPSPTRSNGFSSSFPIERPCVNVPVLTYHSLTVQGSDYRDNDHVAFASDLRTITSLGYRVVSLDRVVRWHGDAILGLEPPDAGGTVAVSFDDGTDFDYHDLPHPTCCVQRSMLNLMRDFVAEAGPDAQPGLHGTSFVIASGEARSTLDRTCIIGKNWMRDSWWGAAVATGLLGIGNHSWTHNHPSLPVALRAAGGQ